MPEDMAAAPAPFQWRVLLQLAVCVGIGVVIGVPVGVWLGWRHPPGYRP